MGNITQDAPHIGGMGYADIPAGILSGLGAPQTPINQGHTVVNRCDGWVNMDVTHWACVPTLNEECSW